MTMLDFRQLAETTAVDDDGQLVEGTYGVLVGDIFHMMDGMVGMEASRFLQTLPTKMEEDAVVDAVLRHAPFDSVDYDVGRVIYYKADLPNVDPGTPYVRAVSVVGEPEAVERVHTQVRDTFYRPTRREGC